MKFAKTYPKDCKIIKIHFNSNSSSANSYTLCMESLDFDPDMHRRDPIEFEGPPGKFSINCPDCLEIMATVLQYTAEGGRPKK